MADPQVVEYVKSNLKKGVAIEGIKSTLRKSGWPEEAIAEGVEAAQGAPVRPGPVAGQPPAVNAEKGEEKKSGGRTKIIIALVVFCILFILFIYVAVTMVSDFRQMFPGSENVLPENLLLTGSG